MAAIQTFPIITTMAAGVGAAFIGGLIAAKLRLPPLVGYLLAGIVLGPHTPGMVADLAIAEQFSEIGIIMLMFGVGLHFSFSDLWKVRNIAIIGALVQIVCATLMGVVLASWWGWSVTAGATLGLALSVASTVVLLKELSANKLLTTEKGRIAIGWLVVEDIVMIFALILLPVLATAKAAGAAGVPYGEIGMAGVRIVLFFALMLCVIRPALPLLLRWVEKYDPKELFTVAIFAVAVGLAMACAAIFEISPALGAFFAGMLIKETAYAEKAEKRTLPFQDLFAVLFFVSIGMLFDPSILVTKPLEVLGVLAIVMFGKAAAAFFIVLAFRYTLGTAFTVSASLSQIGEFSFILAALGASYGLLPEEGRQLIFAAALISIALNPATFKATYYMEQIVRGVPLLTKVFGPWLEKEETKKKVVRKKVAKA